MASERIIDLRGYELLDSRGTPTVGATIELEDGSTGHFVVPSGASTGQHEAIELRDDDESRYAGRGVRDAVSHICGPIKETLLGQDAGDQAGVDAALCSLDGTPNKSKLGANAILAASIATAKAASAARKLPLHEYIGGMTAFRLPVPMFNVLNGGCHADNDLDVQEFMIVPHGLSSFAEAVRAGVEIYRALRSQLLERGHRVSVGDEGGFAPSLGSDEEALGLLEEAIARAGYQPSEQVGIVLDVAASELFKGGAYTLRSAGIQQAPAGELISMFGHWVDRFPILGIEDCLAEDDWDGWQRATVELGSRIQLIGDDIFATSQERLRRGIERSIGNAIIVKPNQVGTLTETLKTVRLAQRESYAPVMSNRSGETEDPSIASLAVGLTMPQIKTGAPCRGERTAKYNELLRIEADLGHRAEFWGSSVFRF